MTQMLKWSAILILGAITMSSAAAQNAPKYLKVGAAVADSTPVKFPVIVNGGFLPHLESVVHDPLHVRALCIDDGTTCVLLGTADVCVLPEDVVSQVKDGICAKIDIPRENIEISSTHCHSAPSLAALLGVPRDETYVPYFIQKAVEAYVAAYNNRTDARMAAAIDFDPDNVYCRRFLMKEGKAWTQNRDFTGSKGDRAQMNPGTKIGDAVCRTGIPNPIVSVVAFQTPDGKPLALLANYSTHYAGAPNLSADYFGVFAEEMRQRLGADENFVAIMTNGTSGDTNCIDFYNVNRKFDMYSVGKSVADAAQRACAKMEFVDWAPLRMTQCEFPVRIRKGTPEQVALAKAHLTSIHNEVKDVNDAYALQTVKLSELPDERVLTLQSLRLGDVGIAFLPNETYSATGHGIRSESPAPLTFVVSMANGYAGYLPTEGDFELGGYTTWRAMSSCCEPAAEGKIRAKLVELLKKVSE